MKVLVVSIDCRGVETTGAGSVNEIISNSEWVSAKLTMTFEMIKVKIIIIINPRLYKSLKFIVMTPFDHIFL